MINLSIFLIYLNSFIVLVGMVIQPQHFIKKCDNKGATIVIAKVKNSEHIIGGYNPIEWDSSNLSKSTNDSFIFSFTNRSNLQSAKVGYTRIKQPSIYCSSNYGPTFGAGYDQDNGNWLSYNPCSYSIINTPRSFIRPSGYVNV